MSQHKQEEVTNETSIVVMGKPARRLTLRKLKNIIFVVISICVLTGLIALAVHLVDDKTGQKSVKHGPANASSDPARSGSRAGEPISQSEQHQINAANNQTPKSNNPDAQNGIVPLPLSSTGGDKIDKAGANQ